MSKLAGKVALVTGASKGIGAEIARHLAQAGASVVVNYSSSKSGAEKVVADITAAGGKAVAVQADLSKPEQVAGLFAETRDAFGKLDILVNNAGVYDMKPLGEITPEHFHYHFNLNVLGLLLATQEAAKLLPEGGSIINISSIVATADFPGGSVYAATKAAVDAVTRTLSAELGARKIRVNSINPGFVATEGNESFRGEGNDFSKNYIAMSKLGRIGHVNDIAPAAVFLASDDSSWITGESLYISGGVR